MHTNVSHSQNSNADDGKKSWSGKSRVETIDKEKCIGGGGTQTPVGSIELAGSPHLEESCESRGSSGLASVPCSMSSSCGSPPALKDPSPDWDPEGPAMEPAESEPPKIEMSEGAAVCMIFCRTSLIFSCRHTLVGNISEYLVWKAAVAWAVDKRRNHQEVYNQNEEPEICDCVCERERGWWVRLTWWEEALLLEQLHDQCSPLVQRSAQGSVRHLIKLQFSQDVFSIWCWERSWRL